MASSQQKQIAFFCPYPYNTAPGQRFRYEQYLDFLKASGFTYKIYSFLSEDTNKILYSKGNFLKKIFGVLGGFFNRIGHLWQARNSDFVFIYREASPIGLPIFEWVLAKILHKKIIYDFDDAIWLPVASDQNRFVLQLKYAQKVQWICQIAYKISTGNDYLCQNAANFRHKNDGVVLNPTTIDTEKMHNRLKNQTEGKITIGWTGTHSTLVYLDQIIPVIQNLQEKFDFDFLVICNQNPEYTLKNYHFIKWQEESEIEDLLKMHIGLMPLKYDAWSEGKCGFKALQYMALGIPAVITPIGVNKKIVDEGINGFLCENDKVWEEKLTLLLQDKNLRCLMGENARKKVLENYSVQSNQVNFLNLFA